MRYYAYTAAVLIFLLAGCAIGPQTYEKSLISACNAYAGALSTAATARAGGDLSADAVARVDSVRAVANPICTADELPSSRAALNQVLDATATLTRINGAGP